MENAKKTHVFRWNQWKTNESAGFVWEPTENTGFALEPMENLRKTKVLLEPMAKYVALEPKENNMKTNVLCWNQRKQTNKHWFCVGAH